LPASRATVPGAAGRALSSFFCDARVSSLVCPALEIDFSFFSLENWSVRSLLLVLTPLPLSTCYSDLPVVHTAFLTFLLQTRPPEKFNISGRVLFRFGIIFLLFRPVGCSRFFFVNRDTAYSFLFFPPTLYLLVSLFSISSLRPVFGCVLTRRSQLFPPASCFFSVHSGSKVSRASSSHHRGGVCQPSPLRSFLNSISPFAHRFSLLRVSPSAGIFNLLLGTFPLPSDFQSPMARRFLGCFLSSLLPALHLSFTIGFRFQQIGIDGTNLRISGLRLLFGNDTSPLFLPHFVSSRFFCAVAVFFRYWTYDMPFFRRLAFGNPCFGPLP